MTQYRDQRVLPYTSQQIYDIVIDIKAYPEFVTGCTGTKILMQDDLALQAELKVGFGLLNETYLSQVTFDPYHFIQAECNTKPFKYMVNRWEFEVHPEGCLVKFMIDFEFKKSLFNLVASQVFLSLSKEIMNSFINRAQKIYGK